MREEIMKIKENAIKEIEACQEERELNEWKVKYLGKKGELTVVLRGMGKLSPTERPIIGSLVNQVRDELELLMQKKEEECKRKILQR